MILREGLDTRRRNRYWEKGWILGEGLDTGRRNIYWEKD